MLIPWSGGLDSTVAPDCRGPEFHDPGGWGIVAFSGGIKAFVHAPQAARFPGVVYLVGSLGRVTARRGSAEIDLWTGENRLLQTSENSRSSLHAAVDDIISCLESGDQSMSTGEDGLAALEEALHQHIHLENNILFPRARGS